MNDQVERLERVARSALTILMVSKDSHLPNPMLCPHGNSPLYPTHAWWCDQCFRELEEALAWVIPDVLPKGPPEDPPEAQALEELRGKWRQAMAEDRHGLAGVLHERLEQALKEAGYERLAFPAIPEWQHPEKGAFYW